MPKHRLALSYLENHCQNGWWPYLPGQAASLEATVWCGIACRANHQIARKTLQHLLNSQNDDGGWSAAPHLGESDWSTYLALLAMSILSKEVAHNSSAVQQALSKGCSFLLNNRVVLYRSRLMQLFVLLWKGPNFDYPRGWPWTKNTYHWVEPTSYAMLALKSLSLPDQDKQISYVLKQATDYLLEVACFEGGWNYGRNSVLGVAMSPLPMTTCLALLALQDLSQHSAIRAALSYMDKPEPNKESILALSWSILARQALGQNNPQQVSLLLSRQHPNGAFGTNLMLSGIATLALDTQSSCNPLKLTLSATKSLSAS